MPTFEYNDNVKFILPQGFTAMREEEDDGTKYVRIKSGEYKDEGGETCYRFSCRVYYVEFNPNELDDEITSENLLDKFVERMGSSRHMKLSGKPETLLINTPSPLSFWGCIVKAFSFSAIVRLSDWTAIHMIAVDNFRDENPDANAEIYENMYEVLKAVRINGKKLSIGSVTPRQIQEALELTFEEDESIDVSPKIQFNFTAGGETTTFEFTSEGMTEVGKEYLTEVAPDESLYPHYNKVRYTDGLGFPGATVVVNAGGTEYNFIPLRKLSEDDEVEESMRRLFDRIVAKDTESYDLDRNAKKMQRLFHVTESAFDSHHDRECELEEGYLHKAYMLSGLRSFAWTLADYCKQHDCSPDDIDPSIATRIANFVATEDWLNYNDTSYCHGLCSGSDLHVYFIPDGVSQTDRKKLLPSKDEVDFVKRMKEKFPTYYEILSEVHSLNALRKDLAYIYPAIKIMWDKLEADRNYDEPLLGNEADIIYAWCALALAAKEPFFSEDGPMSCHFSRLADEDVQSAKSESKKGKCPDDSGEKWMRKYEKYLDTNPTIDFCGTTFVFSGLVGHESEKDNPIVQRVIEKGGQYRTKVSGLTDYLVVNPSRNGQSKIEAAIEQLRKGKNIKIILLNDLENALEGKGAVSGKPISTRTTKPAAQTTETKVSRSDCEIDSIGTLTAYYGKAKAIILPDGIRAIGEYAFFHNEGITSVVIPEGVEAIENGAFWTCSSLKSVTLPCSIEKIGDDAFGKTALTSIIIPDGCKEIGADCFTGCESLESIYVPRSVCDIGKDAFYTFNCSTVIHTPKNSAAANYATEKKMLLDYLPTSAEMPAAENRPFEIVGSNGEDATFVSTVSDPSTWTTETQDQGSQNESREHLIKNQPDTIEDNADEFQAAMDRYSDYFKEQQAEEGTTCQKAGANAASDTIGTSNYFYCGKPHSSGFVTSSPTSNNGLISPHYTASSSTTTQHSASADQKSPTSSPKSEGCYIATAVYGSYDAPQVMTLRRFRDETLRKSFFGRWFIRLYYRLSPPIAKKLKHARRINRFVRSILDKWVDNLNQKQI